MTEDAMTEVDSVLFLQRRYHTNQHPVVETLLDRDQEVRFLALGTEPNEEYSSLEPDLVRFWMIFLLFDSLLGRFLGDMFRYRYGVPSPVWYYRYLREVDPDILIVKDYYFISFVTIAYAKWLGIDLVFYDQAPVYADETSYTKRRLASKLYYLLHRERFVRFSPVLGDPTKGYAIPRSHYIPFLAMSDLDLEEREYFAGDNVNLLMVGKLHNRRKNHRSLVAVVDELADEYDVTLTLVGSLYDRDDPYYRELEATIERRGLEDLVEIKTNVDYDRMQTEYRRHDVYVLPSRRETAAVSHLEAMSEGLPVVCSQTNGTSCYVHEGANGFLVDPNDRAEMREKLERLVGSRDRIREFGRHSYRLAHTEYSPDRFYQRLSWLVREEFQ